jgi:hypothetical protein
MLKFSPSEYILLSELTTSAFQLSYFSLSHQI